MYVRIKLITRSRAVSKYLFTYTTSQTVFVIGISISVLQDNFPKVNVSITPAVSETFVRGPVSYLPCLHSSAGF